MIIIVVDIVVLFDLECVVVSCMACTTRVVGLLEDTQRSVNNMYEMYLVAA